MRRHIHRHVRFAQPTSPSQQSKPATSAVEHIVRRLDRCCQHVSQLDLADHTLLAICPAFEVTALTREFERIRPNDSWRRQCRCSWITSLAHDPAEERSEEPASYDTTDI